MKTPTVKFDHMGGLYLAPLLNLRPSMADGCSVLQLANKNETAKSPGNLTMRGPLELATREKNNTDEAGRQI